MKNPRLQYEDYLISLPLKEHNKELKQLLIDMMDWFERSDTEGVYVNIYKCLDECTRIETEEIELNG
jgi:hypothetical protein